MVGKEINSYTIKNLLGQGGMGSVYRVEHNVLNRTAALKMLHFNFSENPQILERFKNEALAMDGLKHESIVQLLDYGKFENRPFLLLEYIKGQPLDEYIQKVSGPIPEAKALNFLLQMLEGINYAHKKTIVHRDIKPSNFMLTPEGKIKILDFGIAKILSDNNMNMTKEGQKIGTIPYMSPEQIQGKVIDIRSDIYSLGVTLFQMLTGQEPYKQTLTEWELSNQIVFEPLPKAILIYPHITEAMQHLIDKATAKKKEERYQNCEEFILDVENLLPEKEKGTKKKTKKETKQINSAKAKKEYTDLFEIFYEDKYISDTEKKHLKKKQKELLLSDKETLEIEKTIIEKYGVPEAEKSVNSSEETSVNTNKKEKIETSSEKTSIKEIIEEKVPAKSKKTIMMAAIAVVFFVLIGFGVKALFFSKGEGVDYETTNFTSKYMGKMELEGKETLVRLAVSKVDGDWTVHYDFFVKSSQKLTNKQARINTKTNEITFLLKGADDSEKEIIRALNKANISINVNEKVVFTAIDDTWKLTQQKK